MPKELHQQLTDLLMENGCSVTKTGIDALVKYIAGRDQNTTDEVIKSVEKLKVKLLRDEYFGTKVEDTL
jgi:hypothetical protein